MMVTTAVRAACNRCRSAWCLAQSPDRCRHTQRLRSDGAERAEQEERAKLAENGIELARKKVCGECGSGYCLLRSPGEMCSHTNLVRREPLGTWPAVEVPADTGDPFADPRNITAGGSRRKGR